MIKIIVKKIIQLLLAIGITIYAYQVGELAWRELDEGYVNKLKKETWERRLKEFHKGEID